MKLVIYAPNIHCGGGLTLLKELLKKIPEHTHLILDSRLPISHESLKKFDVTRIKPTVVDRLVFAEWYLNNLAKKDDKVLCFSNLPPLIKSKGSVTLFLQNRYLIDLVSLKGLSLRIKMRIKVERIWLMLFRNNIDSFIVQTRSMQALVKNCFGVRALVYPFTAKVESLPGVTKNRLFGKEKLYDFIYVASGEPHKNHRILIDAWCVLAGQGIRPRLCITIKAELFSELYLYIERKVELFQLKVTNIELESNQSIFSLYRDAHALVYPSLFESFGLPLLECKSAGLGILASELDYVRDIVAPDESFDPTSSKSIARAIRRYMNNPESPLPIYSADDFIKMLIN